MSLDQQLHTNTSSSHGRPRPRPPARTPVDLRPRCSSRPETGPVTQLLSLLLLLLTCLLLARPFANEKHEHCVLPVRCDLIDLPLPL
ncbi:hypothetical protein VTN96DRAFT_5133 [Rasamsonia emersonii]